MITSKDKILIETPAAEPKKEKVEMEIHPISNPALAAGLDPSPKMAIVELTRTVNGVTETTKVHPEMVGDHLRAGWSCVI